MSRSTWADIKEHGPPGDVFYQVTAKQFNWEITYPGPDGKFGTKDDVTIENDLHVPVNKVVRIDLDVEGRHPQLLRARTCGCKQDAVPGRIIHVWFEATETGQYEIPCAELCGFGHSGMKGNLTVQSQEDFDKWLKDQVRAEQVTPALAGIAGAEELVEDEQHGSGCGTRRARRASRARLLAHVHLLRPITR